MSGSGWLETRERERERERERGWGEHWRKVQGAVGET